MNLIKQQSGFSLVELVVGVLVMGVAFVGAMYAHAELEAKSTRSESVMRATSLANSVMEVIRAHNFDDNATTPWSSTLGPEEGSASSYDDVDDYAGYSWTVSGYTGFQATSRVFYVNPSSSWLDSTGAVTSYKRILVTVQYDGLKNPLVLTSLISSHGK